ncbi:MAG: alpha/beta fold hydrolase [Alphaproteobacteria bacterium]|nr:alpha/beta fold hydrolase [Alphaproteobacteria bacterium]
MRIEVERMIQRNIKGLEQFTAPPQPVGLTPKDVVASRGTMQLYHYRPMADEIYRVPVLFVMATTNRGYIFDLAPGQSLVEFLLKRGYDVYVLDWSPPRRDESKLRMEDYVLDFIPDAIRHIQQRSGEREVSLIGYCMGGVLSSCYAATHPDGPLTNLICFTTPVDFHHMTLFRMWSDRKNFDVDRLVDTLGNVPAEIIVTSFDMLRPATRGAGQVRLWDNMWSDEYVEGFRRMERWSNETLPLAGEYFRQTTNELTRDNKLYTGELTLGGRPVKLENIKVPIFHIIAEHDHIVTYDASKPLIQMVGSADKEELVVKGGHVSVLAGANAVKRMWPHIDRWLGERST